MARIRAYQPMALLDIGFGKDWHRVKLPEAARYECSTEQEANDTISRLISSGLEVLDWEIVKKK
jgi:hypothetical protein